MALSSEDTRKKVPVVAHVSDLIGIDPHSELIFETPPPDVVNSINECFEQFTSSVEKRSDASVHQPSSDSDSGGSLFITQSVTKAHRTKAVRTERRLGSSKRQESISDDSGDGRENGDTENERGSGGQHAECPKRKSSSIYIHSRRATFPFLLKSRRQQHLSSKKYQILENSEIGGFLKCIKKIEEGYVNAGREISPFMLESELSDNSEGDNRNSDHEVTKVDRTIFVPGYFKGNKQKWLPQSFLEMRVQDSLSSDNKEKLFTTKGKEKKRTTKSTKKNKASASVKKQSEKKLEAPKSRAATRTSSESSVDSLFMEQEKQHETLVVLAACSDAEHSDSARCRHRLTKQTVQCAENLDGDHLVVIEETQRNSIEAFTETAVHMEHDDNASFPSQADDINGIENTVSDLQSENTTEHVEKMNSPVLSDSTFTSKEKKKKKHKLKEQEEAESGADTQSADIVHSVEMDQFSESQTTEMTPKDKEMTNVDDNSATDILSNETSEAPETEQPENIQTSEDITRCPSPNAARIQSVKKKKKDVNEASQYESVDFALDVSSVSQFDNVTDRSTTQETDEERSNDVVEHTEAGLNGAEHSDSVQCAENSHGDNLEVIEDGQRNTVEAVAEPAVEQEDDLRSDNNMPNKSNSLLPPQGGDISIQNDIQQTDSDFGSEDLFRPSNSQKHKNNQIHKATSITVNMEESDQDSDVTQIETEGQSVSIFGPGTPRWCDGDVHAHEDDDDSDPTQIETEGQSVSVFGPGTPNKQFTTQDMNSTKHPESQKTDQSLVGLNAELLSREDEDCNNKKRKTMSRSHKDSEVTDVEETMNVQPSSKHLPLADEPLREVNSISSERLNLGKQRAMVEMETDPQETPLFKNGGLSFIKRKRKGKEKMCALDFIQCDTNVDVSSESPVDDITGVKTTPRENEKSCEVENRVTNEEEASVLHLEETSELLEESVLSTVADNSVKRKKKKKYKLKENEDAEPSVENQSVETVQFSESQTTELTSKITKKKKRKDKERTKMAYVEENSATDIPSNETLDSDRPAELRVNDQSSDVPETNQPEHIETSEEITGCLMSNVTTLKSAKKKKKKKKRDETEEPEYESVDLDVSSMSQFDHVAGVVEQQLIEERDSNENTAEQLEGNTPHVLKFTKRKKKSQNASSPSQSDDIIGVEKQTSGSQSESAEELLEKKIKKKQKLKERKNAELASDLGDNVQLFQHSESPTTDLLSRKTKKKSANKDGERTTDTSSNELLEHTDDRPSEMRGNHVIRSIEATKTNQFEHLQTEEEITRRPSPSVTKLSSGKKKKKRDRSEKHQFESVDENLDVSSVSQLDDATRQVAQKMTKRRPSNGSAVEHLEGNAAHMLKVAKRKKKSQNASSPSQADDINGLENTVSDLQSENTTEHVEKMNSPVLSDSTFTSKEKKKKKHKLKEQEEAESGADTQSADIVHSVEMDQFSESQTIEMTPKRIKKRKDKEMTNVDDNSATDILSNETSEAPETEQPENIQTSEGITRCPSPNVARIQSVKKKKKDGNEASQYESVDFALDVSSVSQFYNVTDRSTTQETDEERSNDVVEHTETGLNGAEHSDSVQCAENSHGDNLEVIEDGQRNTVEAVAEPAVEQEDDLRSDNNMPNKSNSLLPPQGGDISIQNDIQQTDSDFGSEDLFRASNSQKHKNNQIHKATSITVNMEESDQDSDVTQIETEGQSVSIFGPGTPRWCDGDVHAHEDDDSDATQIETEGQSVSVFGPGTPNKQFTTQDMNSTKHPESQKTDQSLVGLNAELLSREDEDCNNKKRKTMSRSHKDSEVTDVEETMNVQPSSKHLPLADEPLREVNSISSEHLNLGKQRAMVEMETDPQETPLFKNGGLSFIKRKRKGKEKMCALDFIQCDTNVDVSSESPVDDITGVETTPRENEKSCEVENRVTNEEEASVLHLEETSELLEESVLSTVADNSVKKKKKKKYKLKENEDAEPSVENQSVETVQFSESQTTELTSKITKKKKRKDKERTKMAYVEENSATDIPSNETLDSDRPAELRVNDQSSDVPEMNQPEHIETSEEITGCLMSNVTTLKSAKKKKKKKKRDQTEEPEYESVDLDVSSMSQFDHVAGVVEQQVIEERDSNENTAEQLEGNTPHVLKVTKRKKKSQNASSPSQSDDIIGVEKQASGSQSENAEELLEKKIKKKQKLKERKNAELASDVGDNVQLFQHSESPTTDLLSRKTKKKSANKDRERTTDSSSNELLEHTDDRPSEMRGNHVIRSIEATKTNQFEHLQTEEEITRCPSPSVTKSSSGKKKKKRDRSEKHQFESVDENLDVSSVSQLDDATRQVAQKMTKRRPSNGSAVEHLEGNTAHMLKVAKRKKKSQNASSPSQVDDINGLENTVSDLQSENTTEHVEKINSPVLSDSTFTSKEKKKKKHKLKEQEEAESGADTQSADIVHSVEMDPPKRTKKKRKNKERTKTPHVEDNSGTDILSNETSEAHETNQLEHTQTSEEITGLKSVKKKKKNGGKESQYESIDFALNVSSVSQFDNVTDRSTTQETIEERPSDVAEHTETELNVTKHKKKRKRLSLSVNNSFEFSSSDAQMQDTVAPERKRKKKRNTDHITNVGGELTFESSDHTVPFERSQSTMLKSPEAITKKSKRKKNKEMNGSTNHIPDDSAELETVQTKRTDSIIQHNNADRQADIIISLGDSADIRKKKKKRKRDTENNITEISMSQNTDSAAAVNGDYTPKRPEKQRQRCHDRSGSVQTECNANIFPQSHRKHDTYEENNLKDGSGAREQSVSHTEDVMLRKGKKKRKLDS